MDLTNLWFPIQNNLNQLSISTVTLWMLWNDIDGWKIRKDGSYYGCDCYYKWFWMGLILQMIWYKVWFGVRMCVHCFQVKRLLTPDPPPSAPARHFIPYQLWLISPLLASVMHELYLVFLFRHEYATQNATRAIWLGCPTSYGFVGSYKSHAMPLHSQR